MNKLTRPRRADTVFVLLIFCLFAMSVLITLMLGAGVYKHMTDISGEGYDERTCLSYIWTKIKNSDQIGKISVGDFDGTPALRLSEVYGDTTYETRIYLYDGWVYELFCEESLDAHPSDGVPIIKTDSLSFEQLDDGLIRASAGSGNVLLYPRSKAGIVRGALG